VGGGLIGTVSLPPGRFPLRDPCEESGPVYPPAGDRHHHPGWKGALRGDGSIGGVRAVDDPREGQGRHQARESDGSTLGQADDRGN